MSFSFVKHPYISTSIDEVDDILIYKDDYFDDFSKLLKEYPKFALISSSCWVKDGYKTSFDYGKFDSTIDFENFEKECEIIIGKEKDSYLEELDRKIERQPTDKKVEFILRRYHFTLKQLVNTLNNLKQNETLECRNTLIQVIINSYKATKKQIEEHYCFIVDFNLDIVKEKSDNNIDEVEEIAFSAFEWATIFYFVSQASCKGIMRFTKANLEDFIKEHNIKTSYNSIKNQYYKVQKRMIGESDEGYYPIEKLEKLKPFLEQHHKETIETFEKELNYLIDESL